MKNIASSEVSTEAVAEALADRLDAAFGFSSGGAEVWLRLAQGLRYGPVDMGEWDAKSRERVLAFPATEFGDVESAGAERAGAGCAGAECVGAECVGDVVEGSIVTRRPTVHEIRGLAGGDYQAWTWCFFDALLVHVTGSEATQIRSECPRTGEAIVVNLREGTLDSSRAQGDWDGRELSVSLPVLFTPGANLREDFCCRSRVWAVHPDAMREAAQATGVGGAGQAGVVYVFIEQALRITEMVAQRLGLTASS